MAGSSPWVIPTLIQAFQAVWKQKQVARLCHLPSSLLRAAEELLGQGNRAGEARDREMGQQHWETKILIDWDCKSCELAQDPPARVRK